MQHRATETHTATCHVQQAESEEGSTQIGWRAGRAGQPVHRPVHAHVAGLPNAVTHTQLAPHAELVEVPVQHLQPR